MKRTISLMLVLLLVVSLFAGCATQDGASTSNVTISDMEKALNAQFEQKETDGKIVFRNSHISGLATKKGKIISVEYNIANNESIRYRYNELYSLSRFKAEMGLYNQLPYDWLTFNLNLMSCVPFMKFLAGEDNNEDEFYGLDTVIDSKKSVQHLNGWSISTSLTDDNTITISATYE